MVPAFPGAEGFGAYTVGGRGGEVYIVTTLEDQGPGSLREALTATGPRTVVFAVSGTIYLKAPIRVTNPYLTIAGQTAPGDGICLAGHTLSIETHDVILRYLRFRPGDHAGVETDALSVRGGSHVIIDHCSFSWSTDSLLDLTVGSGLNTVQWCLLSEALNRSWHSKGAHSYAAGWDGSGAGGSSYHHNLLATCDSRMPRIDKYARMPRVLVDVRNNIIYNWGNNSAYGGEFADMNWVNNYYKPGPATASRVRSRLFESDSKANKMYLSGNYLEGSPRVTADNWRGIHFRSGSIKTLRVDNPFKVAPVRTEPAEVAYRRVLAGAGAVLPKRDPVDERIIRDVEAGTGRLIDSQEEVGGWPELRTYNVPVDSDRDGMPDWWEEAHGLNPGDPEDRNRVNSEGYTYLEVYLHSLTQGALSQFP
ncbi:MAG: pectate lyase [Firmicutes bacterium]|nr:pectate lyase [Bacillota bacterium]